MPHTAEVSSMVQRQDNLGEGATMIDLQVSGTFERNSGLGKKFAEDLDSSTFSEAVDEKY